MFSAARWRLTLVFTAVLTVILIASGTAVYFTSRSVILDRVDGDLQERARDDLVVLTRLSPGRGPGIGPDEFDPGGYFYALSDARGHILNGSHNLDITALPPATVLAEALDDGKAFADTTSSKGDSQRVYVLPVDTSDGGRALLQIGRSTESEQQALSQLRTILIAAVALSIVPAIGGGYVLSGRVLQPIKAAVDSQRAFIADASHELRTPVAVVRTNAELLQRHLQAGRIEGNAGDAVAVEDILSESERMGKLVGQMLMLAEADAGQEVLYRTDVDLSQLAFDTVRSMRALAEARGLSLQSNVQEGVCLSGDQQRLREVLVTVLDNAIKYTEPGGRVDVSVSRDHKRAVVTISDTGQGISAEALPHVFERFYRVDQARSRESGGTGLGLAIARHIVEAHDGSIRIDSRAGQGTTVTIELPAY